MEMYGFDLVKVITDLVEVAAPILVMLKQFAKLSSENKKHAAKQSILQMIMEDQMSWELFRRFPVNYANIHNEYQIYHDNGGNGEVTKKVKEYDAWYQQNEESMYELKDTYCRPQVSIVCEPKKK